MAAGGSAGRAGAGGQPTTPTKTFPRIVLPEEIRWLLDPEIWTPLPGQEEWDDDCTYWQADDRRIQFPPLEWEPCGEGCERADILQGIFDVASNAVISNAHAPSGVGAFLHADTGLRTSSPYDIHVQRIIDLQTGHTVGAVSQIVRPVDGFAWCNATAGLSAGIEFESVRSWQGAGAVYYIKGSLDLSDLSWIWQQPWTTKEERGFDDGYCKHASMEAGGRSFYFCTNVIRGALTPGSSEISVLATPGNEGHFVTSGTTYGDLLVWSELRKGSPGGRIRGWSPDGRGVRTLHANVPVDTCDVGISTTHVAGFSTANSCASYQPEGRLWIAERKPDGMLGEIRLGPVFWPEPVVGSPVKTWGDFAAAVWVERKYERLDDRRRLLLARTTDWAMRDLRGPEGHEIGDAGLTDDHLYVVYVEAGSRRFSHIHRYDLDHFDAIGHPLTPTDASAVP